MFQLDQMWIEIKMLYLKNKEIYNMYFQDRVREGKVGQGMVGWV